MKLLLYISGILGCGTMVFWVIGTAVDFSHNQVLLIIGLSLLGIIYLPALLYTRYMHRKKIRSIIEDYKGKGKDERKVDNTESEMKGWSMNDSPFRSRKSGLSWGGGNVHAANADRGTRRSFLKR